MSTKIENTIPVESEEIFTDLSGNVVKYSAMSDEHDIIKIIEKVADIKNIGKIICGEENSNMLTFEINRYYDNVDLKDKDICIIYKNSLGTFKEDAVNIQYSDKHLRFSWVLSYNMASVSGNVIACINFSGEDEFGNNYSLKTANFKLSIDNALNITSVVVDDSKNWFVDVENRLKKIENNGGVAGDISYSGITNKPKINGVTLEGNKSLDELNIQAKGDYANVNHTHDELHTHVNKNALDRITDEKIAEWDSKNQKGDDGYSPTANVVKSGDTTTITITDKNGTTTAVISDGRDGHTPVKGVDYFDGENGKDGSDGQDGISVAHSWDGTTLTITSSSGTSSVDLKGDKGDKGDPGTPGSDGLDGADGVDGKSAYDVAVAHGFVGTEAEWLESLKGSDGQGCNSYNTSFRWKKVGTYHPGCQYGIKSQSVYSVAAQYTALSYELDGEKLIKFSGACGGSNDRCAYAFVDENNNDLGHSEWVSMQTFSNVVLQVPENAKKVFINGNGAESPYLEVAVEDEMGSIQNLQYLLNAIGRKVSYKDKFAWKSMPTGLIAFTFDDSVNTTNDIVDLFIRKGVPCCFGCIPSMLYKTLPNNETIADAMQRGVDSVGCEVLAHGGYVVTEANVNDENYLFEKFVYYREKINLAGFDCRGIVRTGGSEGGYDNLCNSPITDKWVRLLFDYSDLYGVAEPYNHARVSKTTEQEYKTAIDTAIANKEFVPLLFHQAPEYLENLIDYAIAQGAVICTYAYAYDTYGSTEQEVNILNRLKALESGGSETPIIKTLLSISATKTKTSYNVGETLNTDDIIVTARYSDGTSENVTDNVTVNTSAVDMSVANTYEITVSYGDKSTVISIIVSGTSTDEGGSSSTEYIINNGSFSGESLSNGESFGTMIEVVSGKTYSIEADYEFTNTAMYVSHTITLSSGNWGGDIEVIESVDGKTTGHISKTWTSTSDGSKNLFKIALKNTTVSAYSFTNLYVNEVTS